MVRCDACPARHHDEDEMSQTNQPQGGRLLRATATALTILLLAACSSYTLASPTPSPSDTSTANAYILPGAVDLGATAFGDEPVVIHKGERLRWRNADGVEHDVVADTGSLPEFGTTGMLTPGDERLFTMNTVGATRIHCSIHPQMTGMLVVQEP
jgi:plastocyanin